MVEVDMDKFEAIEAAVADCIKTAKDLNGLKLAYGTKDYSRGEIEAAAVMALMSLTHTWVRPKGVKFVTGFGTPDKKEF